MLCFSACSPKQQDSPAKPPKLLRIGVQPNEKARDLKTFQDALSRKVGLKVEVKAPNNYDATVALLKKNELDFAFLSALTAIQAENTAGAKILLKRVYGTSEFYYSAILTRKDSKIQKLADLRGKKIGFVDPNSTSGYLYPRYLLKGAGLTIKDFNHEFLGTHGKAVAALMDKSVDAIAVWADEKKSGRGAWNGGGDATTPVDPKELRILAMSDAIPSDAFIVREEFYRAYPLLVFKVMETMIELGESKDSILKRVFDVDRMATATTRHYDSVRLLEEFLKKEEAENPDLKALEKKSGS